LLPAAVRIVVPLEPPRKRVEGVSRREPPQEHIESASHKQRETPRTAPKPDRLWTTEVSLVTFALVVIFGVALVLIHLAVGARS